MVEREKFAEIDPEKDPQVRGCGNLPGLLWQTFRSVQIIKTVKFQWAGLFDHNAL